MDRNKEELLFVAEREAMVDQLVRHGIGHAGVLDAMRSVPRHRFVPELYRAYSYRDTPIEIGELQTISQPYIVALMIELVRPRPDSVMLEIGTGSGYLAAVLSRLCAGVYGVERLESLAERSRAVLESLGYRNIEIRVGDGTLGWEEKAPFDGIIVSAAGPDVPQSLRAQLAPGGTLVMPVGGRREQRLVRLEKSSDGRTTTTNIGDVRFVSLIGEEGWKERRTQDQDDSV